MKYVMDYKFDGLINELSKENLEKLEKIQNTKRNDPEFQKLVN